MKRRLLWSVFAVLLVAGLATALAATRPMASSSRARRAYDRAVRQVLDGAQQRLQQGVDLYEDRSSWDNPWIVPSKRYEVHTTESYAFGNRIAQGLEQMFPEFQRVLGTAWEPKEKLKIFVMPNITTYNTFGEEHGAEHSSFYGSFYAADHPEKPVATYYCGNDTLQNQWITHSAAHQFVDAAFPGRQLEASMSEGIASYFALYWDFPGALQHFDRLRSQNALGEVRYIPHADLLSTPLTGYGDRTADRLVQLGVLFSYLLSYSEDTRIRYNDLGIETGGDFVEYVRTTLRGGNAEELAIHALLTQDIDYLEDQLRSFDFTK